jgi:hypothetical protein
MRPRALIALLALLVVASVGSIQASASGGKNFSASLTGYEETPSLSVAGTGSFSARLSGDGTSISYSLTYSGLTGPALFAHIHLGMPAIAGGVIAFLCGGGGQDACPGAGGTVTGTIEAANVVGPVGQGIAAGEFAELVAAMRFGATYVNVHTDAFPNGELRGQIGQ